MAKAQIDLMGVGGGSTSYEIVGVTKSAGSSPLSIPTTKKADNFTLTYPGSSAATIYAYNKDTNTLEYWTKAGHNPTYDISSITATFNDNSIDLSSFNVASAAKDCVVTVIYAD